jgi:hypothetical protein
LLVGPLIVAIALAALLLEGPKPQRRTDITRLHEFLLDEPASSTDRRAPGVAPAHADAARP